MVIVYTSNTGFTREYAQMLAKAERKKIYELSDPQLPQGAETVYLGPLMAGHIAGVDQAGKRLTLRAVCGVGMSPPGEGVLASMRRANYLKDLPLFYLQGGWAPKQVGWLKRRMVNMVTRSTRKTLQAKAVRTPREQEQLDFLLKGGSCVAFENLAPLREWLREQED